MIITENIIDSYLDCYYKSYLKLTNQSGEKHLLEERYENDILECTEKFKNMLSINKKSTFVFDQLTLNPVEFIKSKPYEYFFNINLKVDEYEAKVALKKSIENNQVLFIPVLIIGNEKIKDKHKILLAYSSYVGQLLFLNITDYGEIIYGKNITIKKISFKRFIPKLSLVINTIRKIHENSDQYFFLNKHCKICEYNKTCKSKAIELDHLSLISTIKKSDIRQLNLKGIFTVNQLSYIFKPRRKPKRQKTTIRKHFIALKALAIRKKIIYILDTNIELEDVTTRIYLDVEGYGDTIKFYYLVGIVIEKGSIIIEKSYWISFKEDSKEVYKTLLNELKAYCGDSFTIYHYGKYEIEFFRYLSTTVDDIQEKIFVQKLVSNSKDVLPFFLYEIYFPTFSNDLKSISKNIGFRWQTKEASGLNSIAWRKYWEDEQKMEWKNKLIAYNIEDCLSLKLVVDFLYSICNDTYRKEFPETAVSNNFTEEIQSRYGGIKFGNHNFILEDYNFINRKAYFDYQKNKIFIRTKKNKRSNIRNAGKYFTTKPNQIITLTKAEPCVFCGSLNTGISKN